MLIEKFVPGSEPTTAGKALCDMLKNENIGVSYADMMRLRASGALADECYDVYYVAHENGKCYSRLWNGWGKHDNAIGNFGNFVTAEEMRGQGIGKQMLKVWFDDLNKTSNKPLALFCTAGESAAKLYFPYGFVPAIFGTESGPLFFPLGNSPRDFRKFCEFYYQPSKKLISKKASVQWRHEIDCLLKFALIDMGLSLGIDEFSCIEQALLYLPDNTEIVFTENGRCVGWGVNNKMQIHPLYENTELEKIY